jgi:hypothetical protein
MMIPNELYIYIYTKYLSKVHIFKILTLLIIFKIKLLLLYIRT